MIKLSLKLDVSSSKLLLGFVGVSATIGAIYYLSHQNVSTKSLKSDDEISNTEKVKCCRLSGDKQELKCQLTEKVFKISEFPAENARLETNLACESIKTVDNNQELLDTEATFAQNNDKIVNLDGFDPCSQVENNDNDKTNEHKPDVNKSPAPNNCEDKNVAETKEETASAEESAGEDAREADDLLKNNKDHNSIDEENPVVRNESSNKAENKLDREEFDYFSYDFDILVQYISVDLQQFKKLRCLLKNHKGNKAKRLESFKTIKAFCQTFGDTYDGIIYDKVKGNLSYDDLRYLVNNIFILRTNLWKEIHSNGGNSSAVKNDLTVSENTKKLVDKIIEYLEQLNEAVDLASKSLNLLRKVMYGDSASKVKGQQDLSSVFSEYKDKLMCMDETLEYYDRLVRTEDVRSNLEEIFLLIHYFFTDFLQKKFVGYV